MRHNQCSTSRYGPLRHLLSITIMVVAIPITRTSGDHGNNPVYRFSVIHGHPNLARETLHNLDGKQRPLTRQMKPMLP